MPSPRPPISRRELLLGAATVALAACTQRPESAFTATPGTTAVPPTTPAPSSTGVPTTTAAAPVASGPARFVRSGPPTMRAVALTFHGSGDLGLTRQLLDQARSLKVPITVFAVGQWLEDNPAMAAALLDGGHELANHTYTHPALGGLGRVDVATEITRCRDALTARAGQPGRWFRPSGTEIPTEMMLEEAGKAGYPTVVGYDVDPRDFEDPPAELIAARVADDLHPGAIVSLHTGHEGTVAAFGAIVASVRAAGLAPVLLKDLLRG